MSGTKGVHSTLSQYVLWLLSNHAQCEFNIQSVLKRLWQFESPFICEPARKCRIPE